MLDYEETEIEFGFVHEMVDDAQIHVRNYIKGATFGY